MLLKKKNRKTVTVHQQDTKIACNSAPLNPVPIEEQFRWSHPLSEHSNQTALVKKGKPLLPYYCFPNL